MAGNFKTDESFLEKISIGAIGTQRVFLDLKSHQHRPIELERGSMSYKIWKSIKIKRIRVPDILCVDCGTRIESRAKTNLEITMSHSINDIERAWDFGLNDDDYVALVACKRIGDRPIDWEASKLVQYIKVADLKQAFKNGMVKQESTKGAQEGFETRVTWYSTKASADGRIKDISSSRQDKPKIQFTRDVDKRTITLSLLKNKGKVILKPTVEANDPIAENEILASVVKVHHGFKCSKDVDVNYYCERMKSLSLSDRYAAAKALSHFSIDEKILKILESKLKENEEHIYVKMECAATLARNDSIEGFRFIERCINGDHLVERLEAVIICSEIKNEDSFNILTNCLTDPNQHHEIRAGAAWALGELKNENSIDTLISSFNALEPIIKIEAARAIAKFSKLNSNKLIPFLQNTSVEEKQGLSWAISKSKFRIKDLLPFLSDDETRIWISYIIGVQNKESYLSEIESLKEKDSEVYFAVTVLWKIMESWINGLEEY